jgi:hypothetical protein
MITLERNELQLQPPPLETFLEKYPAGRRRRQMERLYRELLEEAHRHGDPQFVLEERSLATAAALQRWLPPHAQAVVLGVCTLGDPLHQRLSNLGTEDVLAQYVLNEIAVEWLRLIVNELQRTLRQRYTGEGLKIGPSYRPGVGRWPLETQTVIFSLVDTGSIGVTLDSHLIMTPALSNSLIFPVLRRKPEP